MLKIKLDCQDKPKSWDKVQAQSWVAFKIRKSNLFWLTDCHEIIRGCGCGWWLWDYSRSVNRSPYSHTLTLMNTCILIWFDLNSDSSRFHFYCQYVNVQNMIFTLRENANLYVVTTLLYMMVPVVVLAIDFSHNFLHCCNIIFLLSTIFL